LISAFTHFRPYLLNTNHPITVFTDARALIWVGGNREYSIACNSLANKLAQLQIEIPHIVYSVPSETNYLADVFSRSFNTSRFLDKRKFALSKIQANKIPPLTEPFVVDAETLYAYFSNTLNSEDSDSFSRNRAKISTPKPIKNLYKLFEKCTPEEKYYSAIRLLQGWNDPAIKPTVKLNSITSEDTNEVIDDPIDLLEQNDILLFTQHCEQVIKETMESHYKNLDAQQRHRIINTLDENLKKLIRQNMRSKLKEKFISHEVMLNNLSAPREAEKERATSQLLIEQSQATTPVYYSLLPQAKCHPRVAQASPGIDIPIQADLTLEPGESLATDSGIQFYIPAGFYMQLASRLSAFDFNIHIHHGVLNNDFNGTIKLFVKNNNSVTTTIPANTALVQGLILPVVHPHLNEIGIIQVNSDRHAGAIESADSKMPPPREIRLTPIPLSPLHTLIVQRTPLVHNVPEINTNIILPADTRDSLIMAHAISRMNKDHNCRNMRGQNPPLIKTPCAQAEILTLTRSCLDKTAHLNAIRNEEIPLAHRNIEAIKREVQEDMCKKLAIISIDLIKNQSITASVLAKAQQSDDLLAPLRENIHTDAVRGRGYVIKNKILYKTYKLPFSEVYLEPRDGMKIFILTMRQAL
jgi:dUTPase